jgi:hypothetical protein
MDVRDDVRRWFEIRRPDLPHGSFLLAAGIALPGLLCGGAGLAGDTDAVLAGLLFGGLFVLVGVGIAAVSWSNYSAAKRAFDNRPSDDEMDEIIARDLGELERHALDRTGTDVADLVGETVVITGPRLWDVNAKVKWRKGGDQQIRFTPVGATVLNFTKDQVVAYACALDLYTGKPLNETTDEYFYRDIVSVATKTRSSSHKVPGIGMIQMTQAETFELTTSGGTSVEVILRDPGLVKKMGGGEIPTTRAEKAIQTIRKLLREKKAMATT